MISRRKMASPSLGMCKCKSSSCATAMVNGVIWAFNNLECPGFFTDLETDYGYFYQWGRDIAWTTTNPLKGSDGSTVWNGANSPLTIWESNFDPSPEGYHVSTREEFAMLINSAYVNIVWLTNLNSSGHNGYIFQDILTGNAIFLPAAGFR